jgi:hypothetical protein
MEYSSIFKSFVFSWFLGCIRGEMIQVWYHSKTTRICSIKSLKTKTEASYFPFKTSKGTVA